MNWPSRMILSLLVILRASEFVEQYLVKHEFVKRLHQRYRQEGITIPFPIRTLVQRREAAAEGAAPATAEAIRTHSTHELDIDRTL